MSKYKVEFKAFKSGDWYTKTDTESGETLFETPEDADFKAVNGDVSKFQF